MSKSVVKCIALATCLTALGANATAILSPNAVINNTLGVCCVGGEEFRMIDQSGLSVGFNSGLSDLAVYLGAGPTHVANVFGTLWTSNSRSGLVDFDLGSVYSVADFVLWNDANQGGASSGIRNFRLHASLVADFSVSTLLGAFVGELGPPFPGPPIPAELFSFAAADARYIRLEIIDQWGDPNVNVGEVAFGVGNAVIPIPEPAVLALVGIGFAAGLGAARRQAR